MSKMLVTGKEAQNIDPRVGEDIWAKITTFVKYFPSTYHVLGTKFFVSGIEALWVTDVRRLPFRGSRKTSSTRDTNWDLKLSRTWTKNPPRKGGGRVQTVWFKNLWLNSKSKQVYFPSAPLSNPSVFPNFIHKKHSIPWKFFHTVNSSLSSLWHFWCSPIKDV